MDCQMGLLWLGSFSRPIYLGMVSADRDVVQLKVARSLEIAMQFVPGMHCSARATKGGWRVVDNFVNDGIFVVVLHDFFFSLSFKSKLVQVVVSQDLKLGIVVAVVDGGGSELLKDLVQDALSVSVWWGKLEHVADVTSNIFYLGV